MIEFCISSNIIFLEDAGLITTSYSLLKFSTQSLSSWNSLQAVWYVNGTKVVPHNISDLLTPISLANWVCDDGGKNNTGFHFATKCFFIRRSKITCKCSSR